MAKTLYDKIWDAHVVATEADGEAILYIDLHLIHEVTSPQAFAGLRAASRHVRRPDRTLAVADHNVPTEGQELGVGAVLTLAPYLLSIQTLLRPFHDPYHFPQFQDTVMIDGISLHYVLPQNSVCPFSKFHTPLRLNPVTNRDNNIQIIVVNHVSFTISGSCRKFCDNWKYSQLYSRSSGLSQRAI